MRGSDGNQAPGSKKEGQRVGGIRVGESDRPIRHARRGAEGRKSKDTAISGKVAVGETTENIQGVMPWGTDSECVEESAQRGRIRGGREGPVK